MDSLEIQLIEAVQNLQIDVVKSLLEKGANVNYIPTCGKSPLSTAASLGNIPLMRSLLSKENWRQDTEKKLINNYDSDKDNHNDSHLNLIKNIHTSRENKQNLGYYVFVHCDEPGRNVYSNKNENLDAETPEGMESLEWDVEWDVDWGNESELCSDDDVWANQYKWYASILDRTGGFTQEQSRGCDINLQDFRGRTAVHYATDHSQLEALSFLVSAGCRVDVGDVDAVTPLHLAAMRDRREVAELLLASGANVNRKTADKMAPLHYAAVRGLEDMVTLLLKAGATIDSLDANDRTPLLLAVNRNHLDTVRLLVSQGAKVNIEEIHGCGYTPLCEAVWNKSVEIASLLLSAGAKLTQSPHLLHYAVLHRHTQMAELLLSYGAYPNLRDDQGDTPLLVAIKCGHIPTIKQLLQYEANPNCGNSITGITPLLEAVKAWNCNRALLEEIILLLCSYDVDLDSAGWVGGITSLFYAVSRKLWQSADALVRAGTDVTKASNQNILDITVRHFPASGALAYLLVAAGYNMVHYNMVLPKDCKNVDSDSLTGWLTNVKCNPRRLKDLCRIKIRSQMGNKLQLLIPALEIPQSVKQYLLFQDIDFHA